MLFKTSFKLVLKKFLKIFLPVKNIDFQGTVSNKNLHAMQVTEFSLLSHKTDFKGKGSISKRHLIPISYPNKNRQV